MKRILVWLYALIALAGGSFAWWVDSRNDEPQAAVLVILVVTFCLGLLTPRKAWLWAVISGICLPGGYLLAKLSGNSSAHLPHPDWYAASLALIPAFVGAYSAALARSMVSSAAKKS
jgi:hypothetical protein